jgi:putative transposase
MDTSNEEQLIKQLLANYTTPEDLIGENGLLKRLTKKLVEGALGAELTHHLGYEKHAAAGQGSGNSRNGASSKTLKGDFGEVRIEVPRDRNGSFEPKIVGKHQRRFTGFDDKILSMYARGMSTREIQGHLQSGGERLFDLRGDRCGSGRGEDLAEPPPGKPLSGAVPGRVNGENAPRRPRREPGGLRGDRH